MIPPATCHCGQPLRMRSCDDGCDGYCDAGIAAIKEELVNSTFVQNEQGVWFLFDQNSHYLPLPKWLYGQLKIAFPNPRIIK